MKVHTNNFKNEIKLFGKELDSIIMYTVNDNTIILSNENINSITSVFNGNILKSVMKQLDIDCNVNIPENTIVNYKFGVKIGDRYEYLDFGNYIVYSSEKQEDMNSYKIVCYDKMLNSMIPYTDLKVEYPISIHDYIKAICTELELNFANENTTFANYNKMITAELYLDDKGNSLNYTFRDVLDELAQVTASIICINDNDELEIRYINETNDTLNKEYLKDVNVKFGQKYGPINSIVLSRSAESDNVFLQDEESIEENGLCEIKIIDNQIMNFNDRSDYLSDILEKLNGLEYYINDFTSTGICYYDLCDKYSISIDENTYPCILFNDEINITQGLEENIYTELPNENETNYKKADKTDRRINQAYIILDKQKKTLEAMLSEVTDSTEKVTQMQLDVDGIKNTVSNSTSTLQDNVELLKEQMTLLQQTANNLSITITNINTDGVNKVVTSNGFVFDENGLNLSKDGEPMSATLNWEGLLVKNYDTDLLDARGDRVIAENLTVKKYLITGRHRFEKFTDEQGRPCTGLFWLGDE